MSLAPGVRLGAYEVTAQIGVGGMGEVWRATDTHLNRQVAIKVLPDAFAHDPERLARFEREAKTLASLNHPNIASIYGLEKADGARALVMELVEGPTLADRIATGPIHLEEALSIAKQIAEALEAAHGQGIIHRDLKPANIKVRDDGTVKVLDYGLAKAFEPAGAPGDIATSPTITSPAVTEKGVILGTAAYMSPEQARGRLVDKRTDIWAFGCVLFEMLTGKRVFEADDTSETIATILRGEPKWAALPAETPPHVTRLLQRCLQKDRKLRLHDIGDVQFELSDAGALDQLAPITTSKRTVRLTWHERLIWVAALAVAGSVIGLLWRPLPAPVAETRLELAVPPSTDLTFSISPDGRQIVYVAPRDGTNVLWLRRLDGEVPRPLEGTGRANSPFWSPNSQSIGFFVVATKTAIMKRFDLNTGSVQVITDDADNVGGTWGPSGVILYRHSGSQVLARVSASSGTAVPMTQLTPGATSHSDPQFLPDGRRFLFYCNGVEKVRGVYLGSLDDSQIWRLTDADGPGRYVAPGWLAYLRQSALVARRLDLENRSLSGDAVPIAEKVIWNNQGERRAGFSVSSQGVIAYRAERQARRQLTWFDRNGRPLGTLGQADEAIASPELSRDGKRVVVVRRGAQGAGLGAGEGASGSVDVWMFDGVRSTPLPFNGIDYPLWSPTDNRIGFLARRNGTFGEYVRSVDGAGEEQMLFEKPAAVRALNALTSWSRDGRYVLFDVIDHGPDVWYWDRDGDQKPHPFLNGEYQERLGHFSPDTRWVAYESHEAGPAEIFVTPFPGPGGRWQVSTAGGAQPRWSDKGDELYWIDTDAKLMAAPIRVTGNSVQPGTPVTLFPTKIYLGGTDQPQRGQYNVAPDGRFLINTVVGEEGQPISIVLNWRPDSQR